MSLAKYLKLTVAVVLSLATFSSCTKEGTDFFRGTYGYSVSGNLNCEYETVEEVIDDDGNISEVVEVHNVDFQLVNGRGIMHLEPKGDAMVLTMSSVAGNTLVADAKVSGTDLEVSGTKHTISVLVDNIVTPVEVTLSGSGYKTNGLLVLDIKFSGTEFTGKNLLGEETVYRIKGGSANCVAKVQE